jgi:hypothetical protein
MNSKLEQGVIMKFLWTEKRDAIEIRSRLFRAFQEDADAFSSVYEWIRTFLRGHTNGLDEAQAGRLRHHHIDSRFLSLSIENEFHGVRTLVQELRISLSTVHDRLVNVLGFLLRHAGWIPHLLTQEITAQRATSSMVMLRILQNLKPMTFPGVSTGEESWFFLEYSQNRVWRLGNENAPAKVSQKISAAKHMLTVFWSTTGPLIEEWLPGHGEFNSTYFCKVVIPRLTRIVFPDQAIRCKQPVHLHMDNARPRNLKTDMSKLDGRLARQIAKERRAVSREIKGTEICDIYLLFTR